MRDGGRGTEREGCREEMRRMTELEGEDGAGGTQKKPFSVTIRKRMTLS